VKRTAVIEVEIFVVFPVLQVTIRIVPRGRLQLFLY
jgi:hypothetical protein